MSLNALSVEPHDNGKVVNALASMFTILLAVGMAVMIKLFLIGSAQANAVALAMSFLTAVALVFVVTFLENRSFVREFRHHFGNAHTEADVEAILEVPYEEVSRISKALAILQVLPLGTADQDLRKRYERDCEAAELDLYIKKGLAKKARRNNYFSFANAA